MTLELVFERPSTLAKLRSAPLGKLLDGFCKWLLNHGFSHWTVRFHLGNLSQLNEHLRRARSRMRQSVTTAEIEGFFAEYASRCRNRGPLEGHLLRVRYSVNRFAEHLREEGHFGAAAAARAIYQPLLDEYLQWMRSYQHASPRTLEVRAHSLTQFLQSLGQDATPRRLAKLDYERVEQFVLAYASGNGRSARRSMQSALRTFLRFALHAGYLRQPLDHAVPRFRTYKLATVPRGLAEQQAQEVLRKVDRNTAVGRRDYAILQLLSTYGVRGGQLRALRLDELDWARDQILFKAAKHGKDVWVPMTLDAGEALLDYLQHGRPACSCPEVFLTSLPPYHSLPHSSTLSAIVRHRLRAADIDLPSAGAHAFRYAFATRMLRQGNGLKAIADMLGHRNLSTTFRYAKVDFNALKQVALDWPQEVSP
jgi:integrase/recombinase XerD